MTGTAAIVDGDDSDHLGFMVCMLTMYDSPHSLVNDRPRLLVTITNSDDGRCVD